MLNFYWSGEIPSVTSSCCYATGSKKGVEGAQAPTPSRVQWMEISFAYILPTMQRDFWYSLKNLNEIMNMPLNRLRMRENVAAKRINLKWHQFTLIYISASGSWMKIASKREGKKWSAWMCSILSGAEWVQIVKYNYEIYSRIGLTIVVHWVIVSYMI